MQPIIVTTTCGSREDAHAIASSMLEKRLIACAQIIGPVASSFWWQGTLSSETEYQIIAKTARSLFAELVEHLHDVHPYDIPEIIATDIVAISDDYRNWMISELGHC